MFAFAQGKEAARVEAPSSPRQAYIGAASFLLPALSYWLAPMAAALCLALALLFAMRRALGAWERALDGGQLLLLTVITVGALIGMRAIWRHKEAPNAATQVLCEQAAFSVAAVLLALAVTSSESPLWAVVMLWATLSAEETWYWTCLLVRPPRTPQLTQSPLRSPGETSGNRLPVAAAITTDQSAERPTSFFLEATDEFEGDVEEFPPGYLQQLTRFRDEEGWEVIHGLARAEFLKGQRVQHLHIAFCPPFLSTPELTFEQTSGPEASITAGQVESYGARFDIRLARPAVTDEDIVLEFVARVARS